MDKMTRLEKNFRSQDRAARRVDQAGFCQHRELSRLRHAMRGILRDNERLRVGEAIKAALRAGMTGVRIKLG